MDKILNEIRQERQKQTAKWGEQNHPVKKEDGEYVKPTAMIQLLRRERYRKELIQVAAVAVQMIESLERNGK